MPRKKTTAVRQTIVPLQPRLVKTGRYFFYHNCQHCQGEGRVADTGDGSWYIYYRYQSDSEQSGPLTRAEAIKRMQDKDTSVMMTLIGPDGLVYTLEE